LYDKMRSLLFTISFIEMSGLPCVHSFFFFYSGVKGII
jgi:hypothetical protein